ncbi:MAG: galactokinase [Deinococcota bacterium]
MLASMSAEASMNTVINKARQLFEDTYYQQPDGIITAPGRVNLIGDHTDYVGGWVMPAALTRVTAVAYKRAPDSTLDAVSANANGRIHFDVSTVTPNNPVQGWGGYLAGVAWALTEEPAEADITPAGLTVAIASDVPTASGLSSSASLEVAMARVWREAQNLALDDVQLAQLCKRAENLYVGVPSGIMDQFACSVPAPGQAIQLDCKKLSYQVIGIPPEWAFVILDSGASRSLASSAYAQRVSECEQLAKMLFDSDDIQSLRDMTSSQVDSLDGVLQQRARHLVTENARVIQAAKALDGDDITTFGTLMTASHASLRDDYAVSSSALDSLVETSLTAPGCHGSRLTGAGFGGCTVSLVDRAQVTAFNEDINANAPTAKLITVL